MIRRDIFTACPPNGDYILSATGLTWGVRRITGSGSAASISAGTPNRKMAVAALLSAADDDKVDAWETAGPGSFRLIKANRTSTSTR